MRNGYMLKGKLLKNGYDWWWHSFTAINEKTGEEKPFFIEYFIINPGLSQEKIIGGKKPSYAMIKAGTWGKSKCQINNFYDPKDFSADKDIMKVKIGNNYATETELKGSVSMSDEKAKEKEYMSDSGYIEWDLKAEKVLSYNLGYGASAFFRTINAFKMYWHVGGMKTLYSGKIIFNGEIYNVIPERSYGYQDKNWGEDYTNPWVWLNCNNFISVINNKKPQKTSLDIGGGKPVVFGIPLERKLLMAFYYDGKLYEYNFSKFWKKSKVNFKCTEDTENIYFKIKGENKKSITEVNFKCSKSTMIFINYENPKGEKNHKRLWNGGYASGTVKFYKKYKGNRILIDELMGYMGGCEYGEY